VQKNRNLQYLFYGQGVGGIFWLVLRKQSKRCNLAVILQRIAYNTYSIMLLNT